MSLELLFQSVQGRKRPEDVAEMCLPLLGGHLSPAQAKTLEKAAQGALKRGVWGGYTSMAQDFARPVGLQKQAQSARRMFPDVEVPADADLSNSSAVEPYLGVLNGALGKTMGQSDFKNHRLSHVQRRELGLELSRRQYNKRFRQVARMETKLGVLKRETSKAHFTRASKSRLATEIPLSEFARDVPTACFIAYYTARCNLRSVFTNGSQERPYDEIAAMLFSLCRARETTNWWAIAHVFPDAEVLEHLSDTQKGELLGRYFALLSDVGELLRETWEKSQFNRATMIVQRGDDSTTWNNTAGAWNKARDGWFALVTALGMDEIFETLCPGKVPRLMAADVAYWHHATGGGLHPDTAVWAELPAPWEALSGQKSCGRALVETVCLSQGLDSKKSGWTAPRPRGQVAQFRPTPELVHGVSVGHPLFAKILRDAGFFSGKKLKGAASPKKAAQN